MNEQINHFSVDRLQVKIFSDRMAMGVSAAEAVAIAVEKLLLRKRYVNMIFAAAPSQNELLAALAGSGLDWSRVRAFHMDEYIGLPQAAPQGFGNFLRRSLFEKVSFRDVYYLDGNALQTGAECQRYGDLLRKYPPDIVCLGIGENCHLAFNDPPVADFQDPYLVKVVELDAACRRQQVNDGCFSKLDDVPRQALTLTIPALLQAPQLFCIVPGPTKAEAIAHTLLAPVSTAHPSTILRTHPQAALFLDEAAASLIR